MSEENQEQSFEDAFNELVDGPAEFEPATETAEEPTSEESDDAELSQREEEKEEGQEDSW